MNHLSKHVRHQVTVMMISCFIVLVFFSNLAGYKDNGYDVFYEAPAILSKFSNAIKAYLSLLPKNELQLKHHIAVVDALLMRQEEQYKITPLRAQRLVESFLKQVIHCRLSETFLPLQNIFREMEIIGNNTLKMLDPNFSFQKSDYTKRWLHDNIYTLLTLSGVGLGGLIIYNFYSKNVLNENFNSEQLENKVAKQKQLSEELSLSLASHTAQLQTVKDLVNYVYAYGDKSALEEAVLRINSCKNEVEKLKQNYSQQNQNKPSKVEELATKIKETVNEAFTKGSDINEKLMARQVPRSKSSPQSPREAS